MVTPTQTPPLFRGLLLLLGLVLTPGCPKNVPDGTGSRGGPTRAYELLQKAPEKEISELTEKRTDVEIDTRDHERTPRVVAKGETPLLTLDGARARLYGDEAGTIGWSVDSLVLVEVLDPAGKVTSRGAIGFSEGVLIGNERVDSVGPLSFTFEPGEVDITRLLPESGQFRVRATALDYVGVSRVSDVYLLLQPRNGGGGDDDLRGQ